MCAIGTSDLYKPLLNISRHFCKLNTSCSYRFSPPLSQFTDKISPLCLPQIEDKDKLTVGTYCYATGKGFFKCYHCNKIIFDMIISISISHLMTYDSCSSKISQMYIFPVPMSPIGCWIFKFLKFKLGSI